MTGEQGEPDRLILHNVDSRFGPALQVFCIKKMVIYLLSFLIFIIGVFIGSFLNVIILRLPAGESIIIPPSYCPYCTKKLKYYDLIPVLSYLFLGGRCRYCRAEISIQYPAVELLTGFLFSLMYFKYGFSLQLFIYILLVSLLIIVSFIDYKYKIIPNEITYTFIITGFILSLFFNHITFLNSLLGILLPAGLFLLIALIYRRGMGMGDVKLIALIGAFIGWKYTLLGIFLASLIGSVIGLVLIVSGIISRETRIPFAPFISLGTLLSILYGQEIVRFYLSLFI